MPQYGKVIVIKRDGDDGSVFPMTVKTIYIGRDETCDIRFQLPTVSTKQCSISVSDENEILLQNLSQTQPILLNGNEITDACTLKNKDVFMICDRAFRFETVPQNISPNFLNSQSVGSGDFASGSTDKVSLIAKPPQTPQNTPKTPQNILVTGIPRVARTEPRNVFAKTNLQNLTKSTFSVRPRPIFQQGNGLSPAVKPATLIPGIPNAVVIAKPPQTPYNSPKTPQNILAKPPQTPYNTPKTPQNILAKPPQTPYNTPKTPQNILASGSATSARTNFKSGIGDSLATPQITPVRGFVKDRPTSPSSGGRVLNLNTPLQTKASNLRIQKAHENGSDDSRGSSALKSSKKEINGSESTPQKFPRTMNNSGTPYSLGKFVASKTPMQNVSKSPPCFRQRSVSENSEGKSSASPALISVFPEKEISAEVPVIPDGDSLFEEISFIVAPHPPVPLESNQERFVQEEIGNLSVNAATVIVSVEANEEDFSNVVESSIRVEPKQRQSHQAEMGPIDEPHSSDMPLAPVPLELNEDRFVQDEIGNLSADAGIVNVSVEANEEDFSNVVESPILVEPIQRQSHQPEMGPIDESHSSDMAVAPVELNEEQFVQEDMEIDGSDSSPQNASRTMNNSATPSPGKFVALKTPMQNVSKSPPCLRQRSVSENSEGKSSVSPALISVFPEKELSTEANVDVPIIPDGESLFEEISHIAASHPPVPFESNQERFEQEEIGDLSADAAIVDISIEANKEDFSNVIESPALVESKQNQSHQAEMGPIDEPHSSAMPVAPVELNEEHFVQEDMEINGSESTPQKSPRTMSNSGTPYSPGKFVSLKTPMQNVSKSSSCLRQRSVSENSEGKSSASPALISVSPEKGNLSACGAIVNVSVEANEEDFSNVFESPILVEPKQRQSHQAEMGPVDEPHSSDVPVAPVPLELNEEHFVQEEMEINGSESTPQKPPRTMNNSATATPSSQGKVVALKTPLQNVSKSPSCLRQRSVSENSEGKSSVSPALISVFPEKGNLSGDAAIVNVSVAANEDDFSKLVESPILVEPEQNQSHQAEMGPIDEPHSSNMPEAPVPLELNEEHFVQEEMASVSDNVDEHVPVKRKAGRKPKSVNKTAEAEPIVENEESAADNTENVPMKRKAGRKPETPQVVNKKAKAEPFAECEESVADNIENPPLKRKAGRPVTPKTANKKAKAEPIADSEDSIADNIENVPVKRKSPKRAAKAEPIVHNEIPQKTTKAVVNLKAKAEPVVEIEKRVTRNMAKKDSVANNVDENVPVKRNSGRKLKSPKQANKMAKAEPIADSEESVEDNVDENVPVKRNAGRKPKSPKQANKMAKAEPIADSEDSVADNIDENVPVKRNAGRKPKSPKPANKNAKAEPSVQNEIRNKKAKVEPAVENEIRVTRNMAKKGVEVVMTEGLQK